MIKSEHHAVRRILRVGLGFFLVIAGLVLALPGVPGPGLLVALGGLVLLSEHFNWARRLLAWARRKVAAASQATRRKAPPPES